MDLGPLVWGCVAPRSCAAGVSGMVGVGKGMEKAKADAGDPMTPLRLEEVYFGGFLESGLENDQQPAAFVHLQ